MKINGVNGANVQAGTMGAINKKDSVSKNIQSQIERKQKELHEISLNKEMTLEEKMKKRQEIQQEINVLQQQLRQHEIEQQKEAMNGSRKKEKGTSMEEMLGSGENVKTRNSSNGTSKQGAQTVSTTTMTAMISADASMKQAHVQGSIAVQIKGAANVLESEIKMDKGRGASTEKKEAELADLREKSQTATQAQMSVLSDANKVMEAAAEKTGEDKDDKESPSAKKIDKGETDEKEQAVKKADKNEEDKVEYTPVDIYL